MYKYIFKGIVLMALVGLGISCKKFTEIDPPKNKLLPDQVFSNDNTALATLYGIYSAIGGTRGSGGIITNTSSKTGMSADELDYAANNPLLRPFLNNALLADNIQVRNIWTDGYKILFYVNSIIEGIGRSTGVTAPVKKTIEGEARFLRAYYLFYLVNFYGPIPLVTGTDYEKNRQLARAPENQVYRQIIEDLTLAAGLLDETIVPGQPFRPNRWAVNSFLARVYLYTKNWPGAEELATAVIGPGKYQLESDLNKVFLTVSKEAIWQLYPVATGFASYEYRFIPFTGSLPDWPVTLFLLNAFEATDKRKAAWLGKTTVAGKDYYYPFKYQQAFIGNAAPAECATLFRLTELYLVRAEARIMQHKFAEAASDLNVIRSRAGLTDLATFVSEAEGMAAVMRERRVELMFENGHRWFDLKRTGTATTVLQPVKGALWQETDLLYPIYKDELLYAPNLSQNPGYN